MMYGKWMVEWHRALMMDYCIAIQEVWNSEGKAPSLLAIARYFGSLFADDTIDDQTNSLTVMLTL
jgi:hypothetical protein